MKKSDLRKKHRSFDEALSRYQTFMIRISKARRVIRTLTEKQDIAESVVLRLCAHWERFVDEHLVACVNVNHSRLSEFLGLTIPAHPNKNLCEAILFGGKFLDFRSFGDLKGYTKKVLPDTSNPFLQVTRSNSEKIDEVYKIRNYLAHYSSSARRALDRMYKTKYSMSRFQEPGRFLMANQGVRLWNYFGAFEGASTSMKAWY